MAMEKGSGRRETVSISHVIVHLYIVSIFGWKRILCRNRSIIQTTSNNRET